MGGLPVVPRVPFSRCAMRSSTIGLLFCLTAVSAVAQAEEPIISEVSVFSFYKSLSRLTTEPVIVSLRLAMACAAPSLAVRAEEERRAGPHSGALINLYADDRAKKAIEARVRRFPIGAVIVKEKLADHDTATAVGGMVKRAPGFDPDNGDWEYFYAVRSGGFASGRLSTCIACHARAKSDDYVFSVENGLRR
jgi:hypothetical protein